jgi:hypothetical protein
MASRTSVVRWLLQSDPSIRWQVLRDLTDAPENDIATERSRIASEGWGARLLGLQTSDGHWGDDTQHGWMATTDALQLLKQLGADPADTRVRSAVDRVVQGITWYQLDGRPFFDGETEACINGRILGTGAYFGASGDRLLARLLSEQLDDGGWNCEAPPSKRSSFNSTICVLEGLLEYEKAHGPTAAVTQAKVRGQNYLLERRMLRSLSSGAIINERWAQFSFPTVWYYDILRGLDYLRSAGARPDARIAEAVELIKARRDANGLWPLDHLHRDRMRVPIEVETSVCQPSRWITLRALRALDWASAEPES